MAQLGAKGFELGSADGLERGGGPSKLEVVGCYISQIGPLGDGVVAAINSTERIHRLTRS